MRRLTKDEIFFVKKIVEQGQISFSKLLNGILDDKVGFGIDKNNEYPAVNVFYQHEHYKVNIHTEEYLNIEFKKAIGLLFLIEELQRENLIYLTNQFEGLGLNRPHQYFGNFNFNKAFFLNPLKGPDYADVLIASSQTLINKLFDTVGNDINSLPALEAFATNGFRTEEQRSHDESIQVANRGIKIAEVSVIVAVLTAIASIIISVLTSGKSL